MKKYTYLTDEERTLISHYHDSGISICEIGRQLGRNKSSISRELRRNSNKDGYKPDTAKSRYLSRRQKARRIDTNSDLKSYILDRLHEGFTPELIAIRLKAYGHLEGISYINHESIYQWIYLPPQKRNKLHRLLPCCHARRGRRKRVHRGKISERVSIHKRPEVVKARKEIGHWEADLMCFRGNTQHLLVIHERKTRYTVAVKLKNKTAQETLTAMLSFFESLPKDLLKTVTFDNGTEFAKHMELTKALGVRTFFCDVYASWQKGGIENMNGRLRRDLPRKTDLLNMDERELEQIVIGHNITPRKVLGGLSPLEALAKHRKRSIIVLFKNGVAVHR